MNYVEVSKFKFVTEPRYYFYGWSNSPKVVGRAALVKALIKARKFLPKGYNFKIWDMQRPLAVQLKMIASFRRRLKTANPKISQAELTMLVYKFAAKPAKKVGRPDTHRNAGAVDLTIVDRTGQELYMGTDHDDLTEKASTDYYRKKSKLSALDKEAKNNRQLLIQVLTKPGFENYAPEWWHWSYKE